jgi:flagellum-specific peptidoglycan hydrolase FlgJ/N-acetylmuramoyl-L-alanine amidase CwlA
MKIIKNDNFHSGRNCGARTESVKYIVIHYTGSEGTAANNVSYFNNGNRGASAHYFVGQNGEVREYCDPAKWYAWHCGGSLESSHHPLYGKCTNRNSIGIEICTHNNGSVWTFTETAVSAAVELTKYLMQKFGVPADRVIRHWDVTGKSCPRVPGWGAVGGSAEWNKFKNRLSGDNSVTVEPRSLSKGDSGSAVEEMQKMLIACGYSCGKWGADGDWGSATDQAVLAFQRDHGLSVDGVYGPKTKAALTAEYAKKNEKVTPAPAQTTGTGKEIEIYFPSWPCQDSPDDRRGSGMVFIDQNKNCVVYDAYDKNSVPSGKLIRHMKDRGVTHYTAIGSHAHSDHLGGIYEMLDTAGIICDEFICYDPASLKLAGNGSANARSAKGDKEYLQRLIDKARGKGAKIRFVVTGDTITVGEMSFIVYRKQPAKFTEYDTGEAWAYLNDGSITIYNEQTYTVWSADGPGTGAEMLSYFKDKKVRTADSPHHGNAAGKSYAVAANDRSVVLVIEANNEKKGPGSCEFTRYGSRRFIEQGITVWQLDADIIGTAKAGRMTWKQGSKTITYAIAYGAQLYRVRRTWADSKSQKGAYNVLLNAQLEADKWNGEYAVFDWNGKEVYRPSKSGSAKTEQEVFIEKVGAMAKADMAKSGICAAITIAQATLESGWGKSELAVNANNLFGMKKSLSGNTWSGSTWDGKSVYSKETKEVYASGPTTVQADFRAYKDWQASVNDHSAYLAGAKNGSALRYAGLIGETDYKKAAQIIKNGGYATAPDYVDKLCRIVEQYGLTKWNTNYTPAPAPAPAPVPEKKTDVPFLVKVKTGMNIRKGPGTNYPAYRDCPVGIFTIVETSGDWGRLKAGGWLYIANSRWVERK